MSYFSMGAKESAECCPRLTYKERLIGFGVTSIAGKIGYICTIMSIVCLFQAFKDKDYSKFAILFTTGNFLCILATCFLSGPKSQWKKMLHKSRIVTTIVFFVSMICTLIFALAVEIPPLVVISCVVQFAAYFWYTLSFIPFGQKMIKSCCSSMCDCEGI